MMGNNNNTASPPASSATDLLSNVSAGAALSPFISPEFSLFWLFDPAEDALTAMMSHCHVQMGKLFWFGLKIFILLTACPANGCLMWLLLNSRRAMTPSEVLGLNVSIMDVLYCLCLPLDIYSTLHETSNTTHSIREGLFALNVFGCPLLLTFMCVERYMAAAWPIVYIRAGRWENRVVLCVCAWLLTLTVGLLGYFFGLLAVALPLSVIISLLFVVMLLCLLGIVWVLCEAGPGEGSGSSVPLRRRALKNIVAVIVPAAVAYSPLVALVPYMVVISSNQSVSPSQCHVLQLLLLFPNVGLFIGPMFYLSRLRQVGCCRRDGDGHGQNSNTQ